MSSICLQANQFVVEATSPTRVLTQDRSLTSSLNPVRSHDGVSSVIIHSPEVGHAIIQPHCQYSVERPPLLQDAYTHVYPAPSNYLYGPYLNVELHHQQGNSLPNPLAPVESHLEESLDLQVESWVFASGDTRCELVPVPPDTIADTGLGADYTDAPTYPIQVTAINAYPPVESAGQLQTQPIVPVTSVLDINVVRNQVSI